MPILPLSNLIHFSCRILVATIVPLMAANVAQAQSYPTKPIRLIVPFEAGGTTDGIARIVANKASGLLHQPIIVENRPGAGGNVGTSVVANASPDGYTLAMVGNSFAVNPTLFKKMPFSQNALAPIVMVGNVPFVMVASQNSPYKSLPELIAYAKAHPGKINYASGGNGTIGHLGSHWLSEMAKIKMQHIPYKGGSQAITDLIGGQVDIFLDTMITSTPYLKSGQIKPLFVTSNKRLELFPSIPTSAELGFPDLEFSAWVGIVAPSSTPEPILERINQVLNEALVSDDVRQKLAALGAQPMGGSITETTEYMQRETDRWGAVVKASGAVVQ